MSDLKTKPSTAVVAQFLKDVDPKRKEDCLALKKLMQEVTGQKPKMWGSSIVGFGSFHYKYDSGREGDWFVTGFSPRKQNLTLYIMSGFSRYPALMKKLGKHTTGESCLYIKRLDDIDVSILRELIEGSVAHISNSDPD